MQPSANRNVARLVPVRRVRRRVAATIVLACAAGLMLGTAPASARGRPINSESATVHQTSVRAEAQSNIAKQIEALGGTPGAAIDGSTPPPPCSWQVAESAYLRVSGSNHNYGITDLNYCPSSRDVYASGSSYEGTCNTSEDLDCVYVALFTNNVQVAACLAANGALGCNTSQHSDANVESYAEADICYNLACSPVAIGTTAAY
jgi:hypothetical protein